MTPLQNPRDKLFLDPPLDCMDNMGLVKNPLEGSSGVLVLGTYLFRKGSLYRIIEPFESIMMLQMSKVGCFEQLVKTRKKSEILKESSLEFEAKLQPPMGESVLHPFTFNGSNPKRAHSVNTYHVAGHWFY